MMEDQRTLALRYGLPVCAVEGCENPSVPNRVYRSGGMFFALCREHAKRGALNLDVFKMKAAADVEEVGR